MITETNYWYIELERESRESVLVYTAGAGKTDFLGKIESRTYGLVFVPDAAEPGRGDFISFEGMREIVAAMDAITGGSGQCLNL